MAEVAPNVMTVSELAEYFRIHRTTIYRLVRGGNLPGAFKIGSDWRFNREEIDRWRLKQMGEINSKKLTRAATDHKPACR